MATSFLPMLATALLGARAYGKGRAGLLRAYWALLLVEFVYHVPTGERGSLVGLAIMFLVVRYYGLGHRILWRARLAAAPLAILLIFPFGIAYRGDNTKYQLRPGQALSRAMHETFTAHVGRTL